MIVCCCLGMFTKHFSASNFCLLTARKEKPVSLHLNTLVLGIQNVVECRPMPGNYHIHHLLLLLLMTYSSRA